MAKKHLPFKQQRSLKNERWRPYIRYQKETDTWITKAIREECPGREEEHSGEKKMRKRIKNRLKSYVPNIPSIPDDVKNNAAKNIINFYVFTALCFGALLITINDMKAKEKDYYN